MSLSEYWIHDHSSGNYVLSSEMEIMKAVAVMDLSVALYLFYVDDTMKNNCPTSCIICGIA